MSQLAQKVLSFIRQHELIPLGQRLVVGVSGGPDSVCLLDLLTELRDALGIVLHVAHLNHMLRGAESDADARYVAELAGKLKLEVAVGRRDVTRYREERGLSLEEAAREVRYLFLADVVEAVDAWGVAVGHTADDQIETVLMHILRGTGLHGLRGMRPLTNLQLPDGRKVRVVRPLLEVARAETEAYCEERGLSPRTDVTNVSIYFFRNRIRHELLPILERYNPAIRSALLRLALTAGDELDLVERQAEEVWASLASFEAGEVVLRADPLRCLHPALQRHLLRRAVQEIAGDLRGLEAVHVEYMRETLGKPAGTRIDLPGGLVFTVEYGAYRVSAGEPEPPLPPLEGEYQLIVPGETVIPGWRVRAQIVPRNRVQIPPGERWQSCFDAGRVGANLIVRTRRPGDRFQPLGMADVKRVQDFMVDARIPRHWRDRIPIVVSPDQIVWVVGWRIDERVKVTPGTKLVLCLAFERSLEERR